MTTVTTVGYGDYTPRTDAGRIIAIIVMLAGIGFVAVLTAAAAERFMRSSRETDSELGEVLERLDSIARRLDAIEQRPMSQPLPTGRSTCCTRRPSPWRWRAGRRRA
jgi:voltage-gated potassium channel